MARSPSTHPTDGELELLQILWHAGPSGLGQICKALRLRRPVATTTVATMLTVMLDKRLVQRTSGPRGYRWSAKTTRQNAATAMVRKLIDVVFDGSAHRLVTHLLESGEISDRERKELRRLIGAAPKPEK
jgi:BlaI family transcriptional regulator, penicillinase repressor